MEINEKLKVSDGMGAWIKDFQESDAPQFKDKSEKERREMAIAAYMSAKKDVKESAELDEEFSDKEIKMAYGILNDPRYKSGNLTKAVDKIEQIKKGLSKHPGVQKAMKATTEAIEDMEPASPDEFQMAVKQAEFIQYVGKKIVEHLEAQREFPEWMQNKLSALHQKAKDMHSTLGARGMDESTITEAKAYKDFSQWVLKVLELKGEMYTNSAQTQISAILGRNASATWDVKKNRGSISHPDLNESNVSEAKSWKQTSMSAAEAIKKYGKENVKVKKGGLNSGEDQVDVFVESSVSEGKGGSGPRSMFVKDSGDDHIIMQLRSAQDLGGMKAIKFRGGKEAQVNKMDIDTVLKVHDMLSPEGKRKLRIMVSKSPADLIKAATELRKAMK
jgi:hypothetical protein